MADQDSPDINYASFKAQCQVYNIDKDKGNQYLQISWPRLRDTCQNYGVV